VSRQRGSRILRRTSCSHCGTTAAAPAAPPAAAWFITSCTVEDGPEVVRLGLPPQHQVEAGVESLHGRGTHSRGHARIRGGARASRRRRGNDRRRLRGGRRGTAPGRAAGAASGGSLQAPEPRCSPSSRLSPGPPPNTLSPFSSSTSTTSAPRRHTSPCFRGKAGWSSGGGAPARACHADAQAHDLTVFGESISVVDAYSCSGGSCNVPLLACQVSSGELPMGTGLSMVSRKTTSCSRNWSHSARIFGARSGSGRPSPRQRPAADSSADPWRLHLRHTKAPCHLGLRSTCRCIGQLESHQAGPPRCQPQRR